MFFRPRPDGLAPSKKRKAWNMRLTDEINDARTVVRNLRYVHEHATDSAELGKVVLDYRRS